MGIPNVVLLHRFRMDCSGLLSLLLLSLLGTASTRAFGDDKPNFDKDLRPLLKKYCNDCHNDKKKEGELNLARFERQAQAFEKADLWDGVQKRVMAKEMPPEGSKQPSDEERKHWASWAKFALEAKKNCETLATDETQNFYQGHVMSRRLNRAEYNNSIRDLVGIDLKPGNDFPADGSGGEGFDTAGAALFTSAILMERYLVAAEKVINKVLPHPRPAKLSPEVAAAQKKILIANPSKDLPPREAAKKVLTEFARRAFRRPVTDAEIERLLKLFDRGQERKDSYTVSLRLPLQSILISPSFLFLVEPEPEKEGVYRLGHYPLAARMSYFLWSSLPDDELLSLAAAGRLHDHDVLKQQVTRMLKDPKAAALGESFAVQWLGLVPLGDTVKPDPKRFPEFDADLAEAMRRETIMCFEHVFRENRSLVELVDCNYTFINERLAKHYGIPNVTGPQMRQVSLTDRRRGGVLGQASVLTVTSYPLRTSPVLRGRWVLDELLGSRVPPPPPGAGELPKDDAHFEGQTLRQRLEQHRTKPECASCHNRMDPIGFGLENFDPLGRWRSEYGGQPVDSSGKLPSGEKFDGPGELKTVLLKRKYDFVKNLVRKMLGYALGRELNRFDQCVVDDTMKALQENDFKAGLIAEQIVLSYPFQHRFCKK